eukprot:2267992-Prymnesium_polylepis.1
MPCAAGTATVTRGQGECTNCKAGRFQGDTGATACTNCRAGYYCLSGAAAPLPCAGGTWSSSTNLTSASECTVSSAGYFSTTGSKQQTPCRSNTFNPVVGQESDAACISCTPSSNTNNRVGQLQLADCVCRAGYYEHNAAHKWTAGAVDCRTCPSGSSCPDPGVMLATLPIKR